MTSDDSVCGICGKTRRAHYHDTGDDWCYRNTTETFTGNPSDETVMAWMRAKFPGIVANAINSWKKAHGHDE